MVNMTAIRSLILMSALIQCACESVAAPPESVSPPGDASTVTGDGPRLAPPSTSKPEAKTPQPATKTARKPPVPPAKALTAEMVTQAHRWVMGYPGVRPPDFEVRPLGRSSGIRLTPKAGRPVKPIAGERHSSKRVPKGLSDTLGKDVGLDAFVTLGTGPHPAVAAVVWAGEKSEGVELRTCLESAGEDDDAVHACQSAHGSSNAYESPFEYRRNASIEVRIYTWNEATKAYRVSARSDAPPAIEARPHSRLDLSDHVSPHPRIFRIGDELLLVVSTTKEPCNGPQYACEDLDRGYLYALPPAGERLHRLAEIPIGMSTGPEPSNVLARTLFFYETTYSDLNGDGALDLTITPVAEEDDGTWQNDDSEEYEPSKRLKRQAFTGVRLIRRANELVTVELDLTDFVTPYHDRALALLSAGKPKAAVRPLKVAVRAMISMRAAASAGDDEIEAIWWTVPNDPRTHDWGLICLVTPLTGHGGLCSTEQMPTRTAHGARFDRLFVGLASLIHRLEQAGQGKKVVKAKRRLAAAQATIESARCQLMDSTPRGAQAFDCEGWRLECEEGLTGTLVARYLNGRKKREITCRGAQLHGPTSRFGTAGKQKEKGAYDGGGRCGVWRCWDDEGKASPCSEANEAQRTPTGSKHRPCP